VRIAIEKTYPASWPLRVALDQHVRALEQCARELGHATVLAPGAKPDVSIVFGAHLPLEAAGIDHLRGKVVVNSERFLPWIGDDLDAYLIRLRAAREVWCLYPYDVEYLRGHDIPAKLWLYGPDAITRHVVDQAEKVYDYLHVGTVTPHRKRTLEGLKADGRVIGVSTLLPDYDHDRAITASRCVLALAYDEIKNYLPWPRVVRAAALGVRVVTDVYDHQHGSWWCQTLDGVARMGFDNCKVVSDSLVILADLLGGL
jgi:hypothetical protein